MLRLSTALTLLSAQLLAGAGLFLVVSWALRHAATPRRRQARWRRCRASLCRCSPWAALALALGAAVRLLAGAPRPAPLSALLRFGDGTGNPAATVPVLSVALFAAGGLAVSGAYLLAHAGRLESRGRLRPSRLQLRPAAAAQLAGSLALVALAAGHRPVPGAAPVWLAALATLLLAAAVGVLAALSRKPRPGGYIAAALQVTAVLLFVGP